MINNLEDLFEEMPDENASEAEVEAFMDKVAAQPGGLEMIREVAAQVAGGLAKEGVPVVEGMELKSPARFIFRVELLGTQPMVWRRISLPADCAFLHLHGAIQDAMGWEDCHLHQFEIREEGELEVIIGPDCDGKADYSESETRVMDLFQGEVGEFLYRYDFGDDWRHRVVIEDFVGAGKKGTAEKARPKVHDGQGSCPPEDCGGAVGFEAFLKGEHPLCGEMDEDELRRFREGIFDPEKVVFRSPAELLGG